MYIRTPSIDHKNMTLTCQRLLQQQSFTTQHDIRSQLIELGFKDISQSTVSRLLFQLGVVKTSNAKGKKNYHLINENESFNVTTTIASQIKFICHNQIIIIIKTHPGSAQLIARLIDMQPHEEILGTIGGNDTIIVAPKDIMRINQCLLVVEQCLGLK